MIDQQAGEEKKWFQINCGDPLLAQAAIEALRTRYLSVMSGLGAAEAQTEPRQAALFARHETQSLHCAYIVYVTPDAAAQFSDERMLRCACPNGDGLSLLVGDVSAWSLLKPSL